MCGDHEHIYDEYGLCFECDMPKTNANQMQEVKAQRGRALRQLEQALRWMETPYGERSGEKAAARIRKMK